MSYADGPSMEAGGGGFRPRRGVFNHIAVTYTGGATISANPFIETLYVNGVAVRTYTNRQLAVPRTVNIRLGSYFGGTEIAGAFSLAKLRIHDGCLTASDVAANFAIEAPSFIPSPSVTPSNSPSGSITASNTASPTGTPITTSSVSSDHCCR